MRLLVSLLLPLALLAQRQAGEYLDAVSARWDDALARLKAFVEE